jgi:hypothetical protein
MDQMSLGFSGTDLLEGSLDSVWAILMEMRSHDGWDGRSSLTALFDRKTRTEILNECEPRAATGVQQDLSKSVIRSSRSSSKSSSIAENDLVQKIQSRQVLSEMQNAQRRHQSGESSTMLELVIARRHLGVTDPRDIVWTHAGFASDGKSEAFSVDYKSKDLSRLYNYLALCYLANMRDYQVLFHAKNNANPRSEGLASWAPDWRNPPAPA